MGLKIRLCTVRAWLFMLCQSRAAQVRPRNEPCAKARKPD